MASKKSSWWWNNNSNSRNSRWLSENLEEMDRLINEMLKLIEEDGDSFAKKAEMYYQRRPELISHVRDFYRRYGALAQRYDHATGDLAKNIPTEIQSQGSGNWSEYGIEAASVSLPSSPERTPEQKVNHFKPQWRAAGFDFFLGSGRSSDRSRKGSDESSSESGSESDYSKVMDVYENSYRLEARVIGLEIELLEARDKLQEYKNGPKEQCEHLLNRQILDFSPTMEVLPVLSNKNFTALEKQIETLQADLPDHKVEIGNLVEAMEVAAKQIGFEISSRDHIIKEYKTWLGAILNKSMQDKSSLEADEVVSTIDEQTADERTCLEIKILEQEQMIRELKVMAVQFSKRFLQEKYALEAKVSSLRVSSNSYGTKVQVLEKRVMQLVAEKSKVCVESETQITELTRDLKGFKLKVVMLTSEKDELKAQVTKLNAYHVKLIQEIEESQKASTELTNRVRELEDAVDRQRVQVMDGAEGKREAIRQLCLSIEHYRVGYQQLCKRLQVQNR